MSSNETFYLIKFLANEILRDMIGNQSVGGTVKSSSVAKPKTNLILKINTQEKHQDVSIKV